MSRDSLPPDSRQTFGAPNTCWNQSRLGVPGYELRAYRWPGTASCLQTCVKSSMLVMSLTPIESRSAPLVWRTGPGRLAGEGTQKSLPLNTAPGQTYGGRLARFGYSLLASPDR